MYLLDELAKMLMEEEKVSGAAGVAMVIYGAPIQKLVFDAEAMRLGVKSSCFRCIVKP